jgi:cathepsin L
VQEELQHHAVWQANKKFIDEHNQNADKFGYTLAMNEYGDMVSGSGLLKQCNS